MNYLMNASHETFTPILHLENYYLIPTEEQSNQIKSLIVFELSRIRSSVFSSNLEGGKNTTASLNNGGFKIFSVLMS